MENHYANFTIQKYFRLTKTVSFEWHEHLTGSSYRRLYWYKGFNYCILNPHHYCWKYKTKHNQLYISGLYVPTTDKVESRTFWSWHWARDLASNTNLPLCNAEQHCSKALISIPTRNTGITYTPSAKRKDSTAEPITILATSNYSSYDKTQKI